MKTLTMIFVIGAAIIGAYILYNLYYLSATTYGSPLYNASLIGVKPPIPIFVRPAVIAKPIASVF